MLLWHFYIGGFLRCLQMCPLGIPSVYCGGPYPFMGLKSQHSNRCIIDSSPSLSTHIPSAPSFCLFFLLFISFIYSLHITPMASFVLDWIFGSNSSPLCNKLFNKFSLLLDFCVYHMTCLGPWDVRRCDAIRGLKCSRAMEFAFFCTPVIPGKIMYKVDVGTSDWVTEETCMKKTWVYPVAWSHVQHTCSLKLSPP